MEPKPTYQAATITVETAPPTPVEIVPAGTMARLAAAEDLCWEIAYSVDTQKMDLKRIKKLIRDWMLVTKVQR